MRIAYLLFCWVITFGAFAQFPSELWHEGKLVLLNGDTLKGAIKYNLERDIIQLNDARTIEAYTARKLLYFSIVDETTNYFREFYAIPYNVTPDYRTPVFFEVFYKGYITFLGREFITVEVNDFGSVIPGNSYSSPVLTYSFYFADDKGKITAYNKNKKDLLFYMRKYDDEIKAYIKRNRLRTDKKNDLIQIVQYYNSLIKPNN